MDNAECFLKAILIELKEISNKIQPLTNNTNTIELDTSSTVRVIKNITDVLGQNSIGNHISIDAMGGGFSIAINSEKEVVASSDFVVENEQIYSLTLIGNGTSGTAVIRVSGYTPKYKSG